MEKVVTNENFKEILSSSKVVAVDFWAVWCGPCRMLGPTVEEIAGEFAGRAVIGKCNVDENPDLAGDFDIRSIPTILYFKNGECVDRTVGVVSKNEISGKIEKLLA